MYKRIFMNAFFTWFLRALPDPELKYEIMGGASTASHTLNLDESRFAVPHFAVQAVDGW
jgi:hypothetical protein